MNEWLRNGLQRLSHTAHRWIGHDALALCGRIALAAIFWQSGRTKVEGWLMVTDSAVALFETEYDLPLIPPVWGAHIAA